MTTLTANKTLGIVPVTSSSVAVGNGNGTYWNPSNWNFPSPMPPSIFDSLSELTNPKISPVLIISLISYDDVKPETRFMLITLIDMIMNNIAKLPINKRVSPDITPYLHLMNNKTGHKEIIDVALSELIDKKYLMIIGKDNHILTNEGLELVQSFLNYEKI